MEMHKDTFRQPSFSTVAVAVCASKNNARLYPFYTDIDGKEEVNWR